MFQYARAPIRRVAHRSELQVEKQDHPCARSCDGRCDLGRRDGRFRPGAGPRLERSWMGLERSWMGLERPGMGLETPGMERGRCRRCRGRRHPRGRHPCFATSRLCGLSRLRGTALRAELLLGPSTGLGPCRAGNRLYRPANPSVPRLCRRSAACLCWASSAARLWRASSAARLWRTSSTTGLRRAATARSCWSSNDGQCRASAACACSRHRAIRFARWRSDRCAGRAQAGAASHVGSATRAALVWKAKRPASGAAGRRAVAGGRSARAEQCADRSPATGSGRANRFGPAAGFDASCFGRNQRSLDCTDDSAEQRRLTESPAAARV